MNKKSELRIIESIEKVRKILSSNVEANLLIECLTSEHDMQHNFTREEFEKIVRIGGFVARFEEELNRIVSYMM